MWHQRISVELHSWESEGEKPDMSRKQRAAWRLCACLIHGHGHGLKWRLWQAMLWSKLCRSHFQAVRIQSLLLHQHDRSRRSRADAEHTPNICLLMRRHRSHCRSHLETTGMTVLAKWMRQGYSEEESKVAVKSIKKKTDRSEDKICGRDAK